MSELTDLEICKKIADIEGFPEQVLEFHDDHILNYSPLTDKALCFDLMVKHDIQWSKAFNGEFRANWTQILGVEDKCIQRVICLAIIAKHNKE